MKSPGKIILYVLILASCTPTLPAFSQMKRYLFQHYTTFQGISNNCIKDIFQDSRGFLWLGTTNGLNRYDGYEFKHYFSSNVDTNTLPASDITKIIEDKNGNLWIGCWGGVAKYDFLNNRFKRIPFPHYNKIEGLFCDHFNRIWVTTRHGVSLLDTNGHLLKWWDEKKPVAFGTSLVFEDSHKNIWVGSLNGLFLYRESDSGFTRYTNNHPAYTKGNDLINSVGYDMIEDGNGYLWTSGWANGLKRFDPATKNFMSFLQSPEFAGNGSCNLITSERFFNHELWVACQDRGLGTFDTLTHQFHFLRSLMYKHLSDLNHIGDYTYDYLDMPVNKTIVLRAYDNCLWIGAQNGLWKLDLREQDIDFHKLLDFKTGVRAPEIVTTTLLPEIPGTLLITTRKCGLFTFNLTNGEVIKFKDKVLDGLYKYPDYDFNGTLRTADGILWIATNFGLFRVTKEKTLQLMPEFKRNDQLINNSFFSVKPDIDGNVWAASMAGILFFEKGRSDFRLYTVNDFAPQSADKIAARTEHIGAAQNGDVWFSRWGKTDNFNGSVTIYRKKDHRFETFLLGEDKPFEKFPYPKAINDLIVGKDGKCWVSTERGLVMFNTSSIDSFSVFNTTKGLNTDFAGPLQEDALGRIWTCSEEGVSVIDPQTLGVQKYATNVLLPGTLISSITACADSNLYIGFNLEWLGVFPQSRKWADELNGRIRIVSMELDHREIRPVDTILAPYNFNYLRLKFTPLNFLLPVENQFSVSVYGPNGTTSYTSGINEIMIAGLQPGQYRVAINANGHRWKSDLKPAVLTLIISPPFWQNRWFYLIEVIGIVLLLFFGVRVYTRRKMASQKIQYEKLQAVANERLRIASDMHDDLGSGLTTIKLLSEIANIKLGRNEMVKSEVEKILKNASNLSQNLREIIWTMNVSHDNLPDFIAYTRSYAGEYFEDAPIQLEFDLAEHFPDWKIGGEIRRNIFLCIKEALHNVVKHSKATRVLLSFKMDRMNLIVSIIDDGIGIRTASAHFGNGLKSMKNRMEKVAGTVLVDGNHGTTVTFCIALQMG